LQADGEKPAPSEDALPPDSSMPKFKGAVLVCEDNDMNQQVLCEHLARVGIGYQVTNNGREGLEAVAMRKLKGEAPFDLILMDIHMPEMDGLEASSRINDLGVNTPIVAITANVLLNDSDLYKSSGIAGRLNKPFTARDLWKCLSRFLPVVGRSEVDEAEMAQQDGKLMRLLKQNFVKSNHDACLDIRRAIDRGDIKLAHRLAHTLKGNAAQIGLQGVREAAAEAEAKLATGVDAPTAWQLDALEAEVKKALEELAAEIEEAAAPPPAAALSEESIADLLGRLEEMLIKRNPECLDLAEELRTLEGAEELVGLVEDFEFKRALIALLGLKERIGI
jgi:CheY-like chemotaxis protein